MHRGWWVVPRLFSVALGTGVRRRRLRSGGRATPRDVALVMGCAWASGWFCLGLTAWADWRRHVPWPDAVIALLSLSMIAFVPAALCLAAAWLSRLAHSGDGKKAGGPHPLD
ncbi:hypothetical protein OJF2_43540 [Aquisphaera giovannonii]|uniref:Uncharacterized protein n=1 Tax=Aquisphaera giovannonii TaxID=406548 RepID=A0A5B9W640_9BACT|nr:hypothetical protein [Aquisphaera giovannonii]QEH35797.1 hypothetical protein OJF2_43540 [Aquisphaera giovannonii]